ncbi:MAG TPA: cyclic nucleotide-binding domain-containing protein [Terriglobales bacterium]|nr:cyclic nucleotide-binding domain-containing protein [Terriglobales bacterium]
MRKALYILGILDDEDANWLASNGKTRRLNKGTVIIQQAVPSDSVFILIDGQLLVHSANIEVAKLFAGEIVGEISFVDSRPPSATVSAAVDSQVLEIDKSALRAKLRKDLGFASRFYLSLATFLADRLRVATSRLSEARGGQPGESQEDLDELPTEMLENTALASARFDMIVKRLGTRVAG